MLMLFWGGHNAWVVVGLIGMVSLGLGEGLFT